MKAPSAILIALLAGCSGVDPKMSPRLDAGTDAAIAAPICDEGYVFEDAGVSTSDADCVSQACLGGLLQCGPGLGGCGDTVSCGACGLGETCGDNGFYGLCGSLCSNVHKCDCQRWNDMPGHALQPKVPTARGYDVACEYLPVDVSECWLLPVGYPGGGYWCCP